MLDWFLRSDLWMPRGSCGDWPGPLKYSWFFGNLAIAGAYFLIPFLLIRAWNLRRNDAVTRPDILARFAAFILLCGLTHVAEVAVFYWPAYRLYTALLVLTGIVSLDTARILPGVIRHLVLLPSRQAIHDALNLAQAAYSREAELRAHVEQRNAELSARVSQLEHALDEMRWHSGARDAIKGMRELLAGG
jgi:hypothetical protein